MYKLEMINFNLKIYSVCLLLKQCRKYVYQDEVNLLKGLEFPSAIEYDSFVCKF